MQVINTGWVGAQSGNLATTGAAWSPETAVTTQAPDLILLSIGINDWVSGVPIATYTGNLQSMVTAWKAGESSGARHSL